MSAVATTTTLRWSPTRLGAAAALGLWAAMFWMLFLTGRTYLYLSTRTSWLVPTGAIIFTASAIGRLVTGRTDRREPVDRHNAWGFGLMALPVVLVLALPPATLGAYTVQKRATFAGSAIGATARDVTGPLDFVDIGAAQSFSAAMDQLRARAGEPITLEGFVTKESSAPPDEILLTRYIVTCCVADATIAQVRVVGLPPGDYTSDEWLQVTGAVYPVGREVLVAADGATQIPVPNQPYLTP
jgi:putative membrane protein